MQPFDTRLHHGRLVGAARSNTRILGSRDIDRKATFFRANTSIYSIYLPRMKTPLDEWEILHTVVQLGGFAAPPNSSIAEQRARSLASRGQSETRLPVDIIFRSERLLAALARFARRFPSVHQEIPREHLSICRLRGQSPGRVAGHEPRTGIDLSKRAAGTEFRAIPVRAKTHRQNR